MNLLATGSSAEPPHPMLARPQCCVPNWGLSLVEVLIEATLAPCHLLVPRSIRGQSTASQGTRARPAGYLEALHHRTTQNSVQNGAAALGTGPLRTKAFQEQALKDGRKQSPRGDEVSGRAAGASGGQRGAASRLLQWDRLANGQGGRTVDCGSGPGLGTGAEPHRSRSTTLDGRLWAQVEAVALPTGSPKEGCRRQRPLRCAL